MSCNRENITWQSKDKTWNVGLYSYYDMPAQDGEEWDYEWDVEYDHSSFFWASKGHRTAAQAQAAYTGNPGFSEGVPYSVKTAKEIKAYEELAFAYFQPAAAEKKRKAKVARENAEFRKDLVKTISEDKNLFNVQVRVNFSLEESISKYGSREILTGYPKRDGDWVTVKGQRVYNMKTGRVNMKLVSVERAQKVVYR